MRAVNSFVLAGLSLLPVLVMGQGGPLNPSDLLKPLGESWPTYNGDYSGRRFSSLKQVDRTNVQHLTLAWMTHVNSGSQPAATDAGPMRGGNRDNVIEVVGGEGDGTINIRGGNIKASLLQVEGTFAAGECHGLVHGHGSNRRSDSAHIAAGRRGDDSLFTDAGDIELRLTP